MNPLAWFFCALFLFVVVRTIWLMTRKNDSVEPKGSPPAPPELVKPIVMPTTKRCPYCAEEIQWAAIKCKFCSSDLSGAEPRNSGPRALACQNCNVVMIATQKRKRYTVGGCAGGLLIIIGVIACITIVGLIGGLICIGIGVVILAAGPKETVMVCPNCGRNGAILPSD